MPDENAIIIEAWNTVLFDKFSRFKHLLVEGLSSHSNAFFSRRDYPADARILDVGCGFGDTSVLLGKKLGPGSRIVGVDCAENFIKEGRKLVEEEGLRNVEFLTADVQFEDLGGPHDFAFGRFGTMFFNMPGAALRNIRKHLVPGGRLDMIVWRKREDNPWLYEAEQVVREIVPVVSHEETDQVHCGPGPFSMSGPDMVSSMLKSAGFFRISFERHDSDICIGRDLDDAIEFAMALGPAGEIIRLAGEVGDSLRPQVVKALRNVLSGYDTGRGVFAPSSTWFVSALRAD